jgi:hypothetical protein
MSASVINKDVPHHLRGQTDKLPSAFPFNVLHIQKL